MEGDGNSYSAVGEEADIKFSLDCIDGSNSSDLSKTELLDDG